MAYKRKPAYEFENSEATGINEIPVGSIIYVADTAETFRLVDNQGLTGSTKIKEAIESGVVSSDVPGTNIFNFLYYADEEDSTPENPNGTNSRILGMNPATMKLEKEIKLKPYSHAGSCDRAAFSDKMYVRCATTHYAVDGTHATPNDNRYMGVVDLVDGKWKKGIAFRWKPRSSGAYNRYRDMHAVTTKEWPWIYLIDCPTDKIVFQYGYDHGTDGAVGQQGAPTYDTAQGNDGGNATGHAVWLDANHFALLDRHNVNIQIFKIENDIPPYAITKTQTLPNPTGCHSLRSFEAGLLLQDRVFFAAIEGAKDEVGGVPDHAPELWKMTFDSTTGQLSTPEVITFDGPGTGSADDNIHHFGVGVINGRKVIAVPLTRSCTTRIIDVETWQFADGTNGTDNLQPASGYYQTGANTKPGHCDFCTADGLQLVILTNHSGKTVTVIDLADKSITDIPIPTLVDYTNGSGFTMAHANHVIGTKYYFFDAYYNESTGNKGTFYEVDLITKTISRSTVTGGKPVQSFS